MNREQTSTGHLQEFQMDDDTTDAAWAQKQLDEQRRREDDELMSGRPEYFPLQDIIGKKIRVTFASGRTATGRLAGHDPIRVVEEKPPYLMVIVDQYESIIIYPE